MCSRLWRKIAPTKDNRYCAKNFCKALAVNGLQNAEICNKGAGRSADPLQQALFDGFPQKSQPTKGPLPGADIAYSGIVAEQVFTFEAMKRGYRVSMPLCGQAPYDRITEMEGVLCRVQIKSTFSRHHGDYKIAVKRWNKKSYTSSEIDILACFLAPLSHWYLLPIDLVTAKQIYFADRPNSSKYGPYFSNWGILRNFPDYSNN